MLLKKRIDIQSDQENLRVSKWMSFFKKKKVDTRTEEEKLRDNISQLTEDWIRNRGKSALWICRSTFPIKNSDGDVVDFRTEIHSRQLR